MNDETVADLKQFVAGLFTQHLSELKDELMNEMNKRFDTLEAKIDRVDAKVDQLSNDVADALTVANDEHGKQLKNHERRITKLEHKAA